MVINQQNTLLFALHLLPETGRRQAADASANDHQIEFFLDRQVAKIKGFAITPQLVGMFE